MGPIVRASASESRSQARNRERAFERLAAKLDDGLRVEPTRRPTRPTKGSQVAPGRGEATAIGDQAARRRARRATTTDRGRSTPAVPTRYRPTGAAAQAVRPNGATGRGQPAVELRQQLGVLVGPGPAQGGEGGVALGHQRGVLGAGVGQPEVARVGERRPDGQHDLALLRRARPP